MGVEFDEPKTGCCGMAGAFGFEADGGHYDVSVACGERVLLPHVRQAADDELILTDGFSCREQISQCTDRQALHLAQVIQLAKRDGTGGPRDGRPEADLIHTRRSDRRRAALELAACAAAGFAIGAIACRAGSARCGSAARARGRW
jgi:hypothetical protein